MVTYIDDHKVRFGVEPICAVLWVGAYPAHYEPAWHWMRWNSALYDRQKSDTEELNHHSDRGVQYLLIRYAERLQEAGIEPSVGSVGDS
jgi:transposase InsO family protein